MDRRDFVKNATLSSMGGVIASSMPWVSNSRPFEISLSQWSFHQSIFGNSRSDYSRFLRLLHSDPDQVLQGDLPPRDIVKQARKLGINAVDLVNVLWFGHGNDSEWLKEFKRMALGEGVEFVLLMCDQLGHVGASSSSERKEAIANHTQWLDTAANLGCSQFRVNAYGDGSYLEQLKQCAESFHQLAEEAKKRNIELMVENHGHPSSNGAWLAMLMEMTDHDNFHVFLDLDNFFMDGWGHDPQRRYDTKQGVEDLVSFTTGVSAKTYDFDDDGMETSVDYPWCMKTIVDSGFSGWVSAEYEGEHLNEWDGNLKTIELLRKMQKQL